MRYIVSLITLLFMMISCDKVEHKLEGKWQLQTVEENGVVSHVDTVWYNFQTSLFEYQLFDPTNNQYHKNYGYKVLEGETQLELELVNYGKITAKQFVERYTDWDSVKESFGIEELSRKKLILNRAGKTYIFKKF